MLQIYQSVHLSLKVRQPVESYQEIGKILTTMIPGHDKWPNLLVGIMPWRRPGDKPLSTSVSVHVAVALGVNWSHCLSCNGASRHFNHPDIMVTACSFPHCNEVLKYSITTPYKISLISLLTPFLLLLSVSTGPVFKVAHPLPLSVGILNSPYHKLLSHPLHLQEMTKNGLILLQESGKGHLMLGNDEAGSMLKDLMTGTYQWYKKNAACQCVKRSGQGPDSINMLCHGYRISHLKVRRY